MSNKPNGFRQALDELEEKSPKFSEFRQRLEEEFENLEETIEKLKPRLDEMKESVEEHAKKAKRKVENQVQENPWATVGIVGLIFFVIGFLFGFKSSKRRD